MTTQEMMKSKAKPGYWFVNIAPIDQPQNWVEQVMPPDVNPNGYDGKLFGYDEKEFLTKQYK